MHRLRHTSGLVTCSAAEPVTPVTGPYVTVGTCYPGLKIQAWELGGGAHIGRTPILGCIAVDMHCTAGCGCHRHGWALAPGCSSVRLCVMELWHFGSAGAAPLPSEKCTGTPNFPLCQDGIDGGGCCTIPECPPPRKRRGAGGHSNQPPSYGWESHSLVQWIPPRGHATPCRTTQLGTAWTPPTVLPEVMVEKVAEWLHKAISQVDCQICRLAGSEPRRHSQGRILCSRQDRAGPAYSRHWRTRFGDQPKWWRTEPPSSLLHQAQTSSERLPDGGRPWC